MDSNLQGSNLQGSKILDSNENSITDENKHSSIYKQVRKSIKGK